MLTSNFFMRYIKAVLCNFYREKMNFKDFLKGIPPRLCWNINRLTIIELIYISAIPFMIKFADPQLFTEGALVENLQLAVLTAAFIIAVTAKKDKSLFVALALLIVLMLMRETNLGRSYFCEKYLSPDEICRWKKMKYGIIVEPLRDLYGLYILYYIWSKKVYKLIWQYILQAPIYLFDSLIFVGAAVAATLAEWPFIDNEILEESSELLMYVGFVNLIFRYREGKLG